MLFWVPLMMRAEEEGIIGRWKEVTTAVVPDRRMRHTMGSVALVFADLAKRFLAWKRGLEGWDMSESMVVNGWISEGVARGELKNARSNLLLVLESRFGSEPSEEI